MYSDSRSAAARAAARRAVARFPRGTIAAGFVTLPPLVLIIIMY
jgi:hypothetical protein